MDTEQSIVTTTSERSRQVKTPAQKVEVKSNNTLSHVEEEPVSEKLQKLIDVDQQYFGEKIDQKRVERAINDPVKWEEFLTESRLVARTNILQVQEMLSNNELQSMQDYDDASLIFQHGDQLEDYKQAFILSLKAIDLGQLPHRSKASQAFDRYMVKSQLQRGVPLEKTVQRFGTQQFPREDRTLFRPNLDGKATPESQELFDMSNTSDRSAIAESQSKILEALNSELNTL